MTQSKIPAINTMMALLLDNVRNKLAEDPTVEAPPIVVLMTLNGDSPKPEDVEVIDAEPYHVSEYGKNVLAKTMDKAMEPESGIDALIYVSEAWVSRRTVSDPRPELQPADDPDRTEAMVFVARTHTTSEVFSFAIDRVKGELSVMQEQSEIVRFGGRMVGSSN